MNLVLRGKPVLLVGGGAVAARKLDALLAAGAEVHVVAPAIAEEIKARAGVTWEERPYRSGDVAGHRLVLAAVDDPAVSRQVAAEAEAEGVWVNSADDPANCTFTLPSVLRRGPITIAVSTGGHSPGLAAWLRRKLEADVGPEYEQLLDLLAEARSQVQAAGRSTEDVDWRNALDSGILDMIRSGRVAEARERLQSWL